MEEKKESVGDEGAKVDLRKEEEQKSSWRRCSITAKQMEEIFDKKPMEQRKEVAEWAARCAEECCSFFLVPSLEGAFGRPEKWKLQCVDTQRFRNFAWRDVSFLSVPPSVSKETLFESAMKILDTRAVGLNLVQGRYEMAGCVHVLALRAPFEFLREFVQCQSAQDELERSDRSGRECAYNAQDLKERQLELKKSLRTLGIEDDQYRHFALSLFQIRAEEDPPLIFLHSSLDGQSMVLWFRDFQTLHPTFHQGLLPGVSHLYWPNYSHKPQANRPMYLCERQGCDSWGGFVTENTLGILDTFIEHEGEIEKDISVLVKKEMIKMWERDYSEKVNLFVSQGKGTNEEAVETYEKELKEREVELRQKFLAEKIKRLSRCSKCKKVRYCSTQCQQSDWQRHKLVCASKK